MSWLQPLSEDFLYCDPLAITPELFRICIDEQLPSADEHKAAQSGEQEA